jgi:hypothetical protein
MLNQQQHLPELVILLQTGLIIGYFSWLYFCNVGDVNGTKSCFFYTMSKDGLLHHSLVTFTANSEPMGNKSLFFMAQAFCWFCTIK